ncbi:ABC transporter substrate-binding protein, partial [Pseudomonas syringae pv. tagetis]
MQAYFEDVLRLGFVAGLRSVDRAEFKPRIDLFEFDMIIITMHQTLSPGRGEGHYFHSSQATITGSKNY